MAPRLLLEFCSFPVTHARVFDPPVCQCELYLACVHQGLLLTALLAVGLELGEAELSEQVTRGAQQVAGEAQLPAGLRRQLGAIG